jgi:26S proteasome regulatory subunit N9
MSPVDFLEKLQVAQPSLAGDAAELATLYQRKLWHQLTLQVEACFSKPEWNQGSLPLDLYTSFIADFAYKINLLKLSQFAVHVAKHIADPQATLDYLQGVRDKLVEQKLPRSEQPLLFLKMHIAQQRLEMGQVAECKAAVEEAKAELAGLSDVDPSVSAAVYYVASLYYKVCVCVCGVVVVVGVDVGLLGGGGLTTSR